METKTSEKKDKATRDRQTFFRVTFKNNCNLLQIADNKANLIISINALVISSIIAISGYGTISQNLDLKETYLWIPIILILMTCMFSMVMAVQAAKPKLIKEKKEGLQPSKSSMLFFGVSAGFNLDDYLKKIDDILPSTKEINEHMSIALYYQGKVLQRKYKLLSTAYNVFMAGLILGVLAFVLFFLI